MTTVKYMILILSLVSTLFSCSKNSRGTNTGGDDADREQPVITIVTPTNNQSFTAGSTIQITANATDNKQVSELHIHINNKTTGVSIKDIHAYPRSPSGSVQDFIVGQSGVTYIIKVMAYDPSINLTTAEIQVTCN